MAIVFLPISFTVYFLDDYIGAVLGRKGSTISPSRYANESDKDYIRTIFYVFVLATSFCYLLSEQGFASTNSYYVEPISGDDSKIGDLSNPWRTLKSSISKLKAGDTLYLRGGRYIESGIRVKVHGTESNQITIRSYPGENAVIDGGYQEFRNVPNSDWEIYDPDRKIYRSVKIYSKAQYAYGYFEIGNKRYRFVPYENYADLSTDNEDYTNDSYTYLGPGVFWNCEDEHIYIRLRRGSHITSLGYLPWLDIDPRQVRMYIFGNHEVMIFPKDCYFVNLEGINLMFQNYCLKFESGTHHISVKNSNILGGRYHILIQSDVHNLIFDYVAIEDSFPPWIAWTDVKKGKKPGHRFQGAAIELGNRTYEIEIKNCFFKHTWDGIDANRLSHDIHIHDNIFSHIRDDAVSLGSACYNIEIDKNKMLFVAQGISRYGSGSPLKIGTKYIHHNIIDCSGPMLGSRNDPNKLLDKKWHVNSDRLTCFRPFGRHRNIGFGAGDPWKIYNNTILMGKDVDNGGIGCSYRIESFYDGHPQEVYNNIFIQISDHWLVRGTRVADGSQIFDGNIYYRALSRFENYLFFDWKSGTKSQGFMSLSEFKASHYFRDTKTYYPPGWENSGIEADPHFVDSEYRPSPKGPAACGGISLPTKWPGQDGLKYRGAQPPTFRNNAPKNVRVIP